MPSVIPINVGEAIFEAFWDDYPEPELKAWRLTHDEARGASTGTQFAGLRQAWRAGTSAGAVIVMERDYDSLACDGFDDLIFSAAYPKDTRLLAEAESADGHVLRTEWCGTNEGCEYLLDLAGATSIRRLRLTVESPAEQTGAATLFWWGLRNRQLTEGYIRQYQRYAEVDWKYHLAPADRAFTFKPRTGVFLAGMDIEEFRRLHDAYVAEHGDSPFLEARKKILAENLVPEKMVREHTGAWWNTLVRERDTNHFRKIGTIGAQAAIVGAVLKDAELLRLAGRWGMALALCDKWTCSHAAYFPGSAWDIKAFITSSISFQLATIFEFAHESLIWKGKEFVKRRMAEHGIGHTNEVAWAWEYIFHNNQLCAFSSGRVGGSLVLETDWPRTKPYTDQYMRELSESISNIFLPDGSFVEGAGYYQYSVENALPCYFWYAAQRGVDPVTLLPECLRNASAFAEVYASSDERGHFYSVGECGTDPGIGRRPVVAYMAAMHPDSQWTAVYRKLVREGQKLPLDPLVWMLDRRIPSEAPAPKAFAHLPEGGQMVSHRLLDGRPVRLFLMGNRAGCSHQHEDKGSFILECAGETFAMDTGGCAYDDVNVSIVRHCQGHNMLVPVEPAGERPHPDGVIAVDVKPVGFGDATAFHAEIDATPGWETYYTRWHRTWDSPTPASLTITDTYALRKGTGVECIWCTERDARVNGREVILEGQRARVILTVPDDVSIRVESRPLPRGRTQNRILFGMAAASGTLAVSVRIVMK